MSERIKTILKISAAGILLVGTVSFGVYRMLHSFSLDENELKVWFYDQSEDQLYVAAKSTIPPDKGMGGEKGDGVRAVVVACCDACDDPAARRIAYIETYADELKQILAEMQVAHAKGRPYTGTKVDPDSDFFRANTFVRRTDDTTWHALSTPEGRKITTQWQKQRCPDNCPWSVCTP